MQHQQYLPQHPLGSLSGPGQEGSHPGVNNGGQPWGGPFPSLHLWPMQDTFAMKMIHLPEGQRIKVGRQTNNKTVPGERNAYFDSKVLSRLHAEIWESGGKIYIRDVRSSNGTFINGDRLSPEGAESEPVQLKSEDQVEFGIDIVSEDNRTIVHHRVAAKAYCVFNQEDAAFSARELVNYQVHDRGSRRMPLNGHHQGENPMAHAGPPVMSAGGKAGALSFEHVLTKLQAELRTSKETGAELQNLATTFTDIQETLSGGLNGSAAQFVPPQFRSASAEAQAALAGPHGQQAAAYIALQAQLNETQSSLSGHLDKIRLLEGQLKEHESLKHEVSSMREQMEESKREMDMLLAGHRGRTMGRVMGRGGDSDDEGDDDDDARSVITTMDNEESEARVRERRRAEREERGRVERPRTPEPTGINGDSEDEEDEPAPMSPEKDKARDASAGGSLTSREQEMLAQNNELVFRINTLSTEIADAMQRSKTLQEQHSEAMSAVKLLTDRVGALETGIASKVTDEVTKAEQRWESWRTKFEESWKKERESWETERERLRSVVREWEEASRRAHEEEEERQLNERLSEDEYVDEEGDEEDDDDGEDQQEEGEGSALHWEDGVSPKLGLSPGGRKPRRRRPSHKTVLAVRALKAAAGDDPSTGSTTPKALLSSTVDSSLPSGTARPRRKAKQNSNGSSGSSGVGGSKLKSDLSRNASTRTLKLGDAREKDSTSESGKESGDTLKEREVDAERKGRGRKAQPPAIQPHAVLGVLAVAIVVGAIWYKNKE
ncbi:hypothetical protein IAT38_001948 [Cryptococcus sp. DSM 104549]